MVEIGRVIGRIGDFVVIVIGDEQACEACEIRHSCLKISGRKVKVLDKQKKYNIGSIVKLSTSQSRYILGAFLLFIIPLLFLIAFYFIGKSALSNENLSVVSGIAGFLLGFFTVLIISKIERIASFFRPKILEEIETKTFNP